MKIVHVMDWYIPEMGYQENFLPSEQKKLGHDVQIITSDKLPVHDGGYENHIGKVLGNRVVGKGIFFYNGVPIHRLLTLLEKKGESIFILKGLVAKIKELKPDIVHAHGATSFSTLIVIVFSKSLGYKVFVDDHAHSDNFRITTFPKKMMIIFLKLFYYIYGSRIRCWMPVTYDAERLLKIYFHVPSEKCQILHLGVNTDLFVRSSALRNSCREDLQIGDDYILLISAGKFGENKDIDILIKTYAGVTEKFPKTKLLLLGGGDDQYMEKIRNLVHSLGITDHVIFHGFVKSSELPAYYNAADIGVWPGAHSITAVESAATGLPIIVPEHNLSYRVLLENESAIGFTRRNEESLKNSLIHLLTDQNVREKIRENCLKTAMEILSWKKIAEKSINIYNLF
jgi:glycosyltransferase involved in cell wall biosynthesis